MRTKLTVLPLLLALAMAGCASTGSNMLAADAPRALPAAGPVSVSWNDPATFSELTASGNRVEAERGDWLNQLALYLRESAQKALPAGQQLQLTIVDIQRAGRYEPWLGFDMQNVRMIRDIYPPRLTLRFRQLDASGQVLAEGERKLVDSAFMMGSTPNNDSDPLRYEKRMIDNWLRREFRSPVATR